MKPVAVGPIFFAAQLLANLVVFWIVLGLEAFSREMQIGTYVIVVSVILLIINGPGAQDYGDLTFQDLITEIHAMAWTCILTGAMLVTAVALSTSKIHDASEFFKYVILLTARASAFSLNLSTGKALVLPTNKFWFVTTIVVKVVSGAIYTRAIVVQSTAVQQKIFVPMNAATIVFVNAITGIIVWEDWRVVNSWVGYVCVFLLLALGCGLLLGDLALLNEAQPETFRGARLSMVVRENRLDMLDRLKYFGQEDRASAMSENDISGANQKRPSASHRRHTMAGLAAAIPPSLNPGKNHPLSRSEGSHVPLKRSRSIRYPLGRPSALNQQAWRSVYAGCPRTTMSMHQLSVPPNDLLPMDDLMQSDLDAETPPEASLPLEPSTEFLNRLAGHPEDKSSEHNATTIPNEGLSCVEEEIDEASGNSESEL